MKKTLLFFIFILSLNTAVFAEDAPCFDPIGKLDWDFFIDNIELKFESCSCEIPDNPTTLKAGFVMKLAEPIAMIEVTDTPWNFPCFDMNFDDSPLRKQGSSSTQVAGEYQVGKNGFSYSHFIIYPIFGLMNYVQDYVCFERFNVLNLAFLGEVLPTHNNDILSSFVMPLRLLFSNPVAQMACAVDCAASTFSQPLNAMPWCSGCWGSLATDTGYIDGNNRPREAALLATRLVDFMHYTFALTKTTNSKNVMNLGDGILRDTMCRESYFPQILKNQYFLQIAYPVAWDAQPIGRSGVVWENFKNLPWAGNDFVFALWRERTFCAEAYDCKYTFTGL